MRSLDGRTYVAGLQSQVPSTLSTTRVRVLDGSQKCVLGFIWLRVSGFRYNGFNLEKL